MSLYYQNSCTESETITDRSNTFGEFSNETRQLMETLSKRQSSTENWNAKRPRADEKSENLIQQLEQESREIQELQYCINSKLNDIQTLLLENRDLIKKNLDTIKESDYIEAEEYNKVNQLESHINEFVFAHPHPVAMKRMRGNQEHPLASVTAKRQDDTDAIGIYKFEHSVA